MKSILIFLTFFLIVSPLSAQSLTEHLRVGQEATIPELDSNTAFFEGTTLNYIIYPPANFVLLVDEVTNDGYSMAFVPKTDRYDSSGLMITAVYYDLTKKKKKTKEATTVTAIINSDTTAMRKHYGDSLIIGEYTDTVWTLTNQPVAVFFFEDTTRFIPNVMTAYLDGGTEVLIFELTIALGYPRFKAEEIFLSYLKSIKALEKGKLGE